jgi:hypothetical protein
LALGDLSEKQLLGLTAAVVGAVLVIMAGILFWMYIRYKKITDEIRTKSDKAVAMEAEAEQFDAVQKAHDEAMTRFHEVLKRVPDEPQASDLDAQMSEQAANAKLKIRKIELVKERSVRKKTAKRGSLEKIRIHIQAEGGFNAFGQFINNIEHNMDRFVAVTGFKITAFEDGLVPGGGGHEIEIDLVTYWYSGSKKAAPAKSPVTAGR